MCETITNEETLHTIPMHEIKNIIFDIGKVLLEYRWKDMLTDHGLSPEEAVAVGRTMFDDPLWYQMDLSAAGEEQQVIRKYREKYPQYADTIEWFINHSEYMHVPREDVWQRVHQLKELGYPLYLLSNYPETMFRKHALPAPFIQDMSGGVISFQIGQLKPHAEIYRFLLKKYHLSPSECLFFDDRKDNTAGARREGIHAITVTSRAFLVETLDQIIAGAPYA